MAVVLLIKKLLRNILIFIHLQINQSLKHELVKYLVLMKKTYNMLRSAFRSPVTFD